MEQILYQFFNLDIMVQAWPIMLRGFGMTLLLCIVVIPSGLLGGLVVALASTSDKRWIRWPVAILVDIFRAIPPLALLIMISAGLPFAGIRLSPFTAVCLSFLLNNSAYYGEIYRAGIESIGTGQDEAARSTGLTGFQSMVYVILPQAVRNVLPDLVSNTIEVVKLTSLASVVAFAELLYSADMARSVTYNASPIVMAACFYLVLLWPAVRIASRLERRLST
ncbi:MAG: amino acid ABC transporter permease [Pseudomonadota bacterium]